MYCNISKAALWPVRKSLLFASSAATGKTCAVCKGELVPAVKI